MPGIRVQHRFGHSLHGSDARRAVVKQRMHDFGERKQQCSQKQQECGEAGPDGIHEAILWLIQDWGNIHPEYPTVKVNNRNFVYCRAFAVPAEIVFDFGVFRDML